MFWIWLAILPAPPALAGAIGSPCRSHADCVIGAECTYNTCDFVSPCSAVWRSPEGQITREQRWEHDAQGRLLRSVTTRPGAPPEVERWTWHSDRAWVVEVRPEGAAAPTLVIREWRDAERRVERLEETIGERTTTTYRWPTDWRCPMPQVEVHDARGELLWRVQSTCDGNQRAAVWVDGRGTEQRRTTSVFREGRLVERTTRSSQGTPTIHMRMHRSAQGAIEGMSIDVGGDGTVDEVETRDLSCWAASPTEVRRVR